MKLEVFCPCCHEIREVKKLVLNAIPLSKDPEQPMDRAAKLSLTFSLSCGHECHLYLQAETCIGTDNQGERA